MQITTLQASKYKGCKVYIRRIDNIFEYLVIFDGELYTTHNVITKPFFRKIMGLDYTDEQLQNITKAMQNTAEVTVDYLLDQQKSHK